MGSTLGLRIGVAIGTLLAGALAVVACGSSGPSNNCGAKNCDATTEYCTFDGTEEVDGGVALTGSCKTLPKDCHTCDCVQAFCQCEVDANLVTLTCYSSNP